jgi:hypothetical protein
MYDAPPNDSRRKAALAALPPHRTVREWWLVVGTKLAQEVFAQVSDGSPTAMLRCYAYGAAMSPDRARKFMALCERLTPGCVPTLEGLTRHGFLQDEVLNFVGAKNPHGQIPIHPAYYPVYEAHQQTRKAGKATDKKRGT